MNLGNDYGFITLDEKNLNFAVKFNQNIINNWTRPYINLTVLHTTQFRNATGTFKEKNEIKLKPCEHSDFEGLGSEFDLLGLNQSLCVGAGSNLTLQGNYQEEIFSYFNIVLTACIDFQFCQDNQTIYDTISKFKQSFFLFFFS